MKLILKAIAALIILASCTKEQTEKPPNCSPVYLLSDKYTIDSVYLKTDTLWQDKNICGADLERLKLIKPYWIFHCLDFPDGLKIECWRYVFTKPLVS
tara:strand:- start:891 stop:1184 length:294 start_codon:yes stop_codon:yes gene_type:complete